MFTLLENLSSLPLWNFGVHLKLQVFKVSTLLFGIVVWTRKGMFVFNLRLMPLVPLFDSKPIKSIPSLKHNSMVEECIVCPIYALHMNNSLPMQSSEPFLSVLMNHVQSSIFNSWTLVAFFHTHFILCFVSYYTVISFVYVLFHRQCSIPFET